MRPFASPMLIGISGKAKPGQYMIRYADRDSAGYYWTVPAGVFFICVVAIGCGGDRIVSTDGLSGGGGGGGGLVYRNNIAVTPGEVLFIGFGRTVSGSTLGLFLQRGFGGESLLIAAYGQNGNTSGTAGSLNAAGGSWGPVSTGVVGNLGGDGRRWNGTTRGNGGAAGSYTAKGTDGGTGGANGAGRSLYGSASSLSLCGAGQGGSGSSNPNGAAGIRIIWGEGRAYPNTNVLDV